MQTKKLPQTILIILSLSIYMVLVGLIRDSMANPQHKLYVNIASTGLLVGGVMVSVYFKEKSNNKPNYKLYFYFTFFIFLFISIALILSRK